jgi:hypothetical protein
MFGMSIANALIAQQEEMFRRSSRPEIDAFIFINTLAVCII